MCQRMKNQEDVESGWYMYGDELSSIRVDPKYASAAVPIPPPPPPQEYYTPVSYQSSGKNMCMHIHLIGSLLSYILMRLNVI